MGSFNVACSVSNISISAGTPILYIPLQKSKYGASLEDRNSSLIYCHAIYSPVTLPIFGEYDDYGGIENIDKNENVKVIEEFFEDKIDSICSIESNPKQITSGMFVIREIYEDLITNPINEYGKKKGDWIPSKEKEIMNLQEWQNKLNNNYYSSILDAHLELRNYGTFLDIYSPQVKEGKMFNELTEFCLFIWGMFAVNVFFFPAMNGFQEGNHYMSKKLYMKSLEIVRRAIIKR